VPMAIVFTTTSTAAVQMIGFQWDAIAAQLVKPTSGRNLSVMFNAALLASLNAAMLLCAIIVIAGAFYRSWVNPSPVHVPAPDESAGILSDPHASL